MTQPSPLPNLILPAIPVMAAAREMWEKLQKTNWLGNPEQIVPWDSLDRADQLEWLQVTESIISAYLRMFLSTLDLAHDRRS